MFPQVDGCFADVKQYKEDYTLLGQYLNATGRPITYSCSWPAYLPDPVKTGFKVVSFAPTCGIKMTQPETAKRCQLDLTGGLKEQIFWY